MLIAFECGAPGNDDICVMNADGSNVRNLTRSPGPDEEPDWSPDGKRIAFDTGRDGNDEIYVMNADGSAVTRLTNSPLDDTEPRWSPDGKQIAFVHFETPFAGDQDPSKNNGDIYVMNADGTSIRRLTTDPGLDADPAWARDGTKIAFTSQRGGDGLFLMNPDGTGVAKVSEGVISPSFSPDGTKVAVVVLSAQGDNTELAVVTLADGNERKITNTPLPEHEPTWSPDGTKIAFRHGTTGPTSEIFVINADGTAERQLTHDSIHDGEPAWSPR